MVTSDLLSCPPPCVGFLNSAKRLPICGRAVSLAGGGVPSVFDDTRCRSLYVLGTRECFDPRDLVVQRTHLRSSSVRTLDRVLGWVLILGGIGHSLGSLQAYKADQVQLLWSLSASLLVWLLGAINLVRAGRHGDRALAWVCLAGNLAWLIAALRFGVLIGDVLDFRPLTFTVLTLGLSGFSVRSLTQAGPDQGRRR